MRFKSVQVFGVALMASLALVTLPGCQQSAVAEVTQVRVAAFNADPSLFEPPTNHRYTLRGEIVDAQLHSRGVPIERVTAHARGSIVVTDSILSKAEIIAVIDSIHHMRFELTEPAVFERQGQLADLIVGVGELTTDSATFSEVRVYLEPKATADGTTLKATIEIPDSLSSELNRQSEPLELALTLEKTT